VKRREFITLLSSTVAFWRGLWPIAARAQYQMPSPYSAPAYPAQQMQPPQQQPTAAAPADDSVGQVATVQGSATVTRPNAAATALKVSDPIFKNDTLETGASSALGVTFDDETTFSLSADTRIVVNEFIYQDGGSGNAASFNVATGTAAFVASLVGKTGTMTITTPEAAIGIRGTTGVVEVPAAGATTAPTVKLYPDADGHVGQIELFERQGNRLGALTQGASAFTIRRGAGGRLIAQPYRIPPQEAARDRGVLQRLNVTHNVGRQMLNQRRQLRGPNRQGPNNQRRQGGPQNFRPGGKQNPHPAGPQNFHPGGPQNPRPGGPRPFNRPPGGPGRPRPRGPRNDNRNR
jgi:FecR protein